MAQQEATRCNLAFSWPPRVVAVDWTPFSSGTREVQNAVSVPLAFLQGIHSVLVLAPVLSQLILVFESV